MTRMRLDLLLVFVPVTLALEHFAPEKTLLVFIASGLAITILAASGARTIRWVPKGTVVTMEFSAERVTVLLDGDNKVERASCG